MKNNSPEKHYLRTLIFNMNRSFRLKLSPILFFLLIVLGIQACNQSEKEQEQPISYTEESVQAFSTKIDLRDIPQVDLSREASSATSDWYEFITVRAEIDKIKDYTLQKLVDDHENLMEAIKNLNDSIPERLDNPAVRSRTNVLYTRAKLLQQKIISQTFTSKDIEKGGYQIYLAFINLEIQLNEVFIEHFPDFEINMDRVQDSILESRQTEEEPRKIQLKKP